MNFSIIISSLALLVSIFTAWLTLLRKGTVRMTQPTVVYFGPDSRESNGSVNRKVYLRTLLYSTSMRGHVIESMFIRLQRGETIQTLNIWVYGEGKLVRGSGIYVGHDGVACNHHFLPPADVGQFEFSPGDYLLQVFASLAGDRRPLLLAELSLNLSEEQAAAIYSEESGIYWDWGPDSQRYVPCIRTRPKRLPFSSLLD